MLEQGAKVHLRHILFSISFPLVFPTCLSNSFQVEAREVLTGNAVA